jgi:hypothetical protein
MPFVNCQKKIRFFSFDFCQNFDVRHFRGDWAYEEPNFFWKISKKFFFFKIFTLVLLDRFLDGFSKFGFFIGEICILIREFWVIFENYSMRMLSMRGNDFIACWACEERISVHALPVLKCEHFYMYNPCWAYAGRILSYTEHTGN